MAKTPLAAREVRQEGAKWIGYQVQIVWEGRGVSPTYGQTRTICSSSNVATGVITEQMLGQYPSLDLSVANPGKRQVNKDRGVSCLGSPANFWTSLIRRLMGSTITLLRVCRFFCKVLAASGPNGHRQTAPCCVYNVAPDRATQLQGTPERAFKMVPLNRNSCICVIRPSRMVLPVPSYPNKWIRSLG
jgi:hypothetical protein